MTWLETVAGVAIGAGVTSVLREEIPRASPASDPPTPELVTDCSLPGASLVALADGQARRIESIAPGDRILGRYGLVTVADVSWRKICAEPLYALNGGACLLSPSQAVFTLEGWKAINPEDLQRRNPDLTIGRLGPGDFVAMGPARPHNGPLGTAERSPSGESVATSGRYLDFVLVESLAASDEQAGEVTFNLRLEDGFLFFANRLLAHALSSD